MIRRMTAAMEVAAASITARVGDGCVIWRVDREERSLEPVAVDHRDPVGREELRELVAGVELEFGAGGWLEQAAESRVSLRPPILDRGVLERLGLGPERVGDVLLTPIPDTGLVIVAVRDPLSVPFGEADRLLLERLATAYRGPLLAFGGAADVGERGDGPTSGSEPWKPALLDSIGTGVWVTDERGTTLYVNRAAVELVGLPPGRILRVPMAEFVSLESTRRSFRSGRGTVLRSDGSKRQVAVTLRREVGAPGAGTVNVYTLNDISETHAREVALRTRLDAELSVGEFARYLLEVREIEPACERAVELVAEQFGADLVILGAVSRDRDAARVLAVAGRLAEADRDRWIDEFPLPERTAVRTAVETGELVRVDDFSERRGYRPSPLAAAAGARSVACAPIAGGNGALAVIRGEANGIEDQELEMLGSVARLLGTRWEELGAHRA